MPNSYKLNHATETPKSHNLMSMAAKKTQALKTSVLFHLLSSLPQFKNRSMGQTKRSRMFLLCDTRWPFVIVNSFEENPDSFCAFHVNAFSLDRFSDCSSAIQSSCQLHYILPTHRTRPPYCSCDVLRGVALLKSKKKGPSC